MGVAEVQAGAGDLDQHLAAAGLRLGNVLYLEYLRPPNSSIWTARMSARQPTGR